MTEKAFATVADCPWPRDWRAHLGYPMLHASLTFRYGAERAAQIVKGEHEETNQDIARWRALGSR